MKHCEAISFTETAANILKFQSKMKEIARYTRARNLREMRRACPRDFVQVRAIRPFVLSFTEIRLYDSESFERKIEFFLLSGFHES